MDRLSGKLQEIAGCLTLEWSDGCEPISTGTDSPQAFVLGAGGRSRPEVARALALYPQNPAAALSSLRPEGGGFAFALWEPHREQLSLGSDPLGLQPLYYSETEDGLRFGSRLSDVIPPGERKLHLAACEHFLQFLSTPPGRTLLGQVKRTPPGERLTFPVSLDIPETLFPIRPERPTTKGETAERLRESLRAAVRAAMQGVDSSEPIGILLSGGIDSTALLSLLREDWEGPIVAIHAAPEGSPDRPYARQMAERFDAEFLDARLSAADARESIAWIVASMEAPGGNASAIANCRAFALAEERGIRRLISGLGSDEIFCGHTKHLLAPWWPMLSRLPRGLRRHLPVPLPGGQREGVRRAMAADPSPVAMHRAMYAFLGEAETERLRGGLATFAQPAPMEWRAPENAGFPEGYSAEILQMDMNLWLRAALTPMAGTLATANGVELVLPFCSPALVNLSASLALSWKVRGFSGKRILRQALDGIVPKEIFQRPRQGFTVPISGWLRDGMKESAMELLDPRRVERWCFLDRGGPGRLLREHLEGKADRSLIVWAWMTFSLWYERYVESGV